MAFCGNCGAALKTQFCVKCGSARVLADPPTRFPHRETTGSEDSQLSDVVGAPSRTVRLGTPVAPGLPILSAVGYGFRHAPAAMRRSPITVMIGIVSCLAIAGLCFAYVPHQATTDGYYPEVLDAITGMFYLGIILQLGIIQEAIRTSRPRFKYDPSVVIQAILYNWLIGFCENVGMLCLLWPFFWIFAKTAWTVPEVFSPDGVADAPKGAFGRSWDLTAGAFWESLAFQLALYMALLIPLFLLLVLAFVFPAGSEFISTPILLVASLYAVAVFWTAMMRFYDALIIRRRWSLHE